VSDYLFHCNSHRAEGETAFRHLSRDFFWAKNPVLPRLTEDKIKVNWRMLLGSESWIARDQLDEFSDQCAQLGLGVVIIPNAGHHIYADQAEFFNDSVREALGDL